MFIHVDYSQLNARQQENYNFQKVAARLANYGFNCIRLTDDWKGADFIAIHIDGETFLKVQLKGRLVAERKYRGKGIHIAFRHGDDLYLYDHDAFVRFLEETNKIGADSFTWHEKGLRSWSKLPAWAITYLENYRV